MAPRHSADEWQAQLVFGTRNYRGISERAWAPPAASRLPRWRERPVADMWSQSRRVDERRARELGTAGAPTPFPGQTALPRYPHAP